MTRNDAATPDERSRLIAEVRARVEMEQAFGADVYRCGESAPCVSTPPHRAAAAAGDEDAEKRAELETLRPAIEACRLCSLSETRTNVVFGVGRADARLMFVGEAPGRDEDKQGEPFVGRAGKLLTKMIIAMGLSREEVFIGNILKCRPPGNRDPEPEEIGCCEPYLHKQLEIIRPRVIVALGRFAAQWLLATKTPIGRMRGKFGRYRGIPTLATYHPAYLLRSPSEKRNVLYDLLKVKAIYNGEAEAEIEIFG
jgi:DNA polymerase